MEGNSPDLKEVATVEPAKAQTKVEIPDQTPAENKGGLIDFIKNFLGRKKQQEVNVNSSPNTDQIDQIRNQTLASIKQARETGNAVIDDNRAEAEALKQIETLGGTLTPDEQKRKAVHVASAKADETKQPLTEEMVAQVQEELKQKTAPEPTAPAATPPEISKIPKPATPAEVPEEKAA